MSTGRDHPGPREPPEASRAELERRLTRMAGLNCTGATVRLLEAPLTLPRIEQNAIIQAISEEEPDLGQLRLEWPPGRGPRHPAELAEALSELAALAVPKSSERPRTTDLDLRAQQALLQAIADAVPSVIYAVDLRTGTKLFASGETAELLGFQSGDRQETGLAFIRSLMHPEDAAPFEAHLRSLQTLRPGQFADIEYRLRHRDGHWVWFWSRDAGLSFDEEGRPDALVGLATDITELKVAQFELQQARARAEEGTRAKSAFLATMSHELRTPLNGVIGASSLLLESQLDPDQKGLVDTVSACGSALLQLVDDVLDLSKVEAGRLDLEMRPFRIRACVEDSIDLVSPRAAESDVELAWLIDPAVPGTALGDEGRLRQVLLNLLGNAVKFSAGGTVQLIVAPSPAGGLRFEVEDTGIGMAPDQQAKLFQPFEQADGSISRRFGGTGLGLAISRRLVERMGGQIGVSSVAGEGSTFWFEVPLAAPTGATPARCERPMTVWISEERPATRRTLENILRECGMIVDDADTPPAASRDAVILVGPHASLPLTQTSSVPIIRLRSLNAGAAQSESEAPAPSSTRELRWPTRSSTLLSALQHRDEPPRPPSSHREEAWGLRVLVAEDNVVNQRLTQHMLKKLGCHSTVVENGLLALQELGSSTFDVVLMDLRMPVMDGLSSTRRIRAELPKSKQPVIIALTADARRQDEADCLDAGMDSFLSKPMTLNALSEKLAAIGRRPT